MKKKTLVVAAGICVAASLAVWGIMSLARGRTAAQGEAPQGQYYCPMHKDFTSDKPGDCAICGMSLVKRKDAATVSPAAAAPASRKIKYYRNPMDPAVTSPVPMKDPMGMEYVPVYEAGAEEPGVVIDASRQQLIGVTTERVAKRPLSIEVRGSGKVAYDPGLYVAQEEYVQALAAAADSRHSTLPEVSVQAQALVEASARKLSLMGMNEAEIKTLAGEGKAQRGLYLPSGNAQAWVYANFYEYEISLLKEGQRVAIRATAYPGEEFSGEVAAITPVLDPATRSLRVRIQVQDPQKRLKPEMFVSCSIQVDLGEKLSVPEDAVIDTGTRKTVYVVQAGDRFQQRQVSVGQKAQGYYEVLSGLEEGETVVRSGNFLVDSESKLQGAGTEAK